MKARYEDALTANDEAAAALTHQYWVNFTKTGNPNGQDLPHWENFNTNADRIMLLSNDGAKKSGMIKDLWAARLDLIEQLQPK